MTTAAPAAAASAAASPAAAAPAANASSYDWKGAGLNDVDMALVSERQWKAPGDLVNSYRNLEKLTGVPAERLVKLPGADGKPEEWDSVYTRLGRPEKPEGYNIQVAKGGDEKFAGALRTGFHTLGLSGKQGEGVTKIITDYVTAVGKEQNDAFIAKGAEGAEKLKTEWGAEHDARLALAKQAAKVFGYDDATVDALQRVKGYDGVMKHLHDLGKRLGEADFVGSDAPRPGAGKMTAQEAQAEITRLRADKSWVSKWITGDAEARKTLADLNKIAAPGETMLAA